MPLPAVVVEAPPELAAENARRMIDACSTTVTPGRCELSGSSPQPEPRAVVLVTVREEGLEVVLQVGFRSETGTRWARRAMRFGPADPETERWRSVGLVIGTLVSMEEEQRAVSAKPAPKPLPESPRPRPKAGQHAPPPSVDSPERSVQLSVDVRLVAGPGLEGGALRAGVALTAGLRLGPIPLWVIGTARHQRAARDANDVRVTWTDLGGGLRYVVDLDSSWALEAELTAEAERIEADVSSSPSDTGALWSFRPRAKLGANLQLNRDFSLVLGAEGEAGRGTDISLSSRSVGRAPALTWGGYVGLRWTTD